MPYRPPRIGQKPYDASWRKQRLALLREQPLCRICLAAGRTVAAAVVDHIIPLNDGGTNTTANLQPLCKRCHDAVKTPADVRARTQSTACECFVTAVQERSDYDGTMNAVELRYALAQRMAWPRAHELAIACMDGIARACKDGAVRAPGVRLITDDARAAMLLADRYGVVVQYGEWRSVPKHDEPGWLAAHRSNEMAVRTLPRHGTQSPRA
jgi:hypothetical protein